MREFCKEILIVKTDLDLQVTCASGWVTKNESRCFKLSYHIAARGAILFNNDHRRAFLKAFEAFLTHCISKEDLELVSAPHPKTGVPTLMLDSGIGAKVQAFRCVYTAKDGPPGTVTPALAPLPTSSPDPWFHILGVPPVLDPEPEIVDHGRMQKFLERFEPVPETKKRKRVHVSGPSNGASPIELNDIERVFVESKLRIHHPNATILDCTKEASAKGVKCKFGLQPEGCIIHNRVHESPWNEPYLRFFRKTGDIRYCCLRDGDESSTVITETSAESWQWTHEYERPGTMDPYPDFDLRGDIRETIVIKAEKGSGKTEAMIRWMEAICPKTVLVVSHSRALVRKLCQDLEDPLPDIVHYRDNKGDIFAPRVACCLNSVPRLAMKYDVVVIDELDSLLGAMDSELISSKAAVLGRLEAQVLGAKVVLAMDACIDSMRCFEWLHALRRAALSDFHCVWNRGVYIDDPPRRAVLKSALKDNIHLEEVLGALQSGLKVVFVTSSKTVAMQLGGMVSQQLPDATMKLYTADSEDRIDDDLDGIDDTWLVDILIYNSAVGPGVSFKARHFDVLYGHATNSERTCPVETFLQILFRVRTLKQGLMTIYYKDERSGKVKVQEDPNKLVAAEGFLDKEAYRMNDNPEAISFMQHGPSGKDRYTYSSFNLSRGLFANNAAARARSLNSYVEVLVDALEKQKIPVTDERSSNNTDAFVGVPDDNAEDSNNGSQSTMTDVGGKSKGSGHVQKESPGQLSEEEIAEWRATNLLSPEALEALQGVDPEELSPGDRKRLLIHKMAVDVYKVKYPGNIDPDFFSEYCRDDPPKRFGPVERCLCFTTFLGSSAFGRSMAEAAFDKAKKREGTGKLWDVIRVRDSVGFRVTFAYKVLGHLIGEEKLKNTRWGWRMKISIDDDMLLRYQQTSEFNDEFNNESRVMKLRKSFDYRHTKWHQVSADSRVPEWNTVRLRTLLRCIFGNGLGLTLTTGDRKGKAKLQQPHTLAPSEWYAMYVKYGTKDPPPLESMGRCYIGKVCFSSPRATFFKECDSMCCAYTNTTNVIRFSYDVSLFLPLCTADIRTDNIRRPPGGRAHERRPNPRGLQLVG